MHTFSLSARTVALLLYCMLRFRDPESHPGRPVICSSYHRTTAAWRRSWPSNFPSHLREERWPPHSGTKRERILLKFVSGNDLLPLPRARVMIPSMVLTTIVLGALSEGIPASLSSADVTKLIAVILESLLTVDCIGIFFLVFTCLCTSIKRKAISRHTFL